MGCDNLRIENEDAGKDVKIGCIHRAVCIRYLNEPLQALPVEALFKE